MTDHDRTILHETDVRAVIDDQIEATIGADQANIAPASTAHALNATFSDTEVEAALNALGTKINAILTALENAGILETGS